MYVLYAIPITRRIRRVYVEKDTSAGYIQEPKNLIYLCCRTVAMLASLWDANRTQWSVSQKRNYSVLYIYNMYPFSKRIYATWNTRHVPLVEADHYLLKNICEAASKLKIQNKNLQRIMRWLNGEPNVCADGCVREQKTIAYGY